MTTETQTFPTLHVASAATGIMLADGMTISIMHQISEFAVGHKIWTHELADGAMTRRIHAAINSQLPGLPTRAEASADWKSAAAKATAVYGETVELVRGKLERAEGPMTSLARIMAITPEGRE